MKRAKCDLVIKGAQIFNVFTGKTEKGDIAVKNGVIAGIGTGYEGEKVYDAAGLTVLPGFLDAHIHVESSTLSPEAFAQIVCAHGATGIVADPHEIVNVCGVAGAEYIKESFDPAFPQRLSKRAARSSTEKRRSGSSPESCFSAWAR